MLRAMSVCICLLLLAGVDAYPDKDGKLQAQVPSEGAALAARDVNFTDQNVGCSGKKYCPPSCMGTCTYDEGPCQYLTQFPGMKYLGASVDIQKFHDNLADTLTLGQVLGGGGVHTLNEVLMMDSFFDVDTPDYVHGRFDQQMGGVLCHYVRANSTMSVNHVGKDESFYRMSSSARSHASSFSAHAGFAASYSMVSISASMSMSGASSSSLSSFSGTAYQRDEDYKLQLNPAAPFRADLLKGKLDYDGSAAARLQYKNLFSRIGMYYVKEITTGGGYVWSTRVTKTAKADSSAYAFDFKAKVAFVSASGGGGHTSKSDEYHKNEDSTMSATGGDDSYRAKMLSYLPAIKNESVDYTNFQNDYANYLSSVPSNPVILDMKVEHIRDKLNEAVGAASSTIMDNLRMSYDELYSDLSAPKLKLLRIQYGLRDHFDSQDLRAQFIELPTELASLPFDAATNTGFSTQYDPDHSCPYAKAEAAHRHLSRTLRYTEHCNAATNLLACNGMDWCPLLTSSNMGMTDDAALNAELFVRLTFVAGVGNDVQSFDFKPCGYGATWAIYWNEHSPYSHNRTQAAKVVGPRYSSISGGGELQHLSDADKDLFPCTSANNMDRFSDSTDPACCDFLASDATYMQSQQIGCPTKDPQNACSGHGQCVFPASGPLHCQCNVGFNGTDCSGRTPPAKVRHASTTPNDDPDPFDYYFLDRHNLDCRSDGSALQEFRQVENHDYTKVFYNYTCAKPVTGLRKQGDHTTSPSSGPKGDFHFLDRQTVQCPGGSVLSRFQLKTSTSKRVVQYDFSCSQPSEGPLGECRNIQTPPSESPGTTDGVNFNFLDRQDVGCYPDEALQKFKLNRPTNTTVNYEMRCCKIN